jgi:hypothetical protein
VVNHLPPAWEPSSSPIVDNLYSLIVGGTEQHAGVRRYNLLYVGAARLARTMDLNEVFETLESNLHFNVAVGSQEGLFVHAGVVGWRGRAIVIPGRSLSGKTTLVAALMRAGATYYSDEYAVFDAQGRVHPYSKPLSIRGENSERRKQCRVEELNGHAGTQPLPVGLVVVTEYKPGAQWRPRVLSPGEAMLKLLDNTLLARIRPELAFNTLPHVVTSAMTLKGKRGEAETIAHALLKQLGETFG